MVDWEEDLKKFLAKKLSEVLGYSISPSEINTIEHGNANVKINELKNDALLEQYAFAITKEDYEKAIIIQNEFISRKCVVDLKIDADNKTGVITLKKTPKSKKIIASIDMVVLPNGIGINWEKSNIF